MIGIILNKGKSEENNDIQYIYESFIKLGWDLLLIPLTNLNDVISKINKCSGVIMQGGDDYLDIHLDIIKYIYKSDIPLLAICMSMQAMGVLFNGNLINVKNHKSKDKYVHDVNIKKNTLLYNILKTDVLEVNSSHNEVLYKTDLVISAYGDYIEAIESPIKKFFLGLQWHPEKMIEYDTLERKIFDYFKEVCDGVR